MLSETGRIVAIDEKSIWVETIQVSTCGSCSVKKGCGQSLLNQMYDGRRHHIEIPLHSVQENFSLGDQVTLEIPEDAIVKGALALYLLPLLMLITGAYLWQLLSIEFSLENELIALFGAVIGFVSGLLFVRGINGFWAKSAGFQPCISKNHSALIVTSANQASDGQLLG